MVGRRIAAARRKMGLNQSQLARLLGVSRQAVSLWEKGTEPTIRSLRKVSRVTKTPMVDLLGGAA